METKTGDVVNWSGVVTANTRNDDGSSVSLLISFLLDFDQVKANTRITVEVTIKGTGEARAGEARGIETKTGDVVNWSGVVTADTRNDDGSSVSFLISFPLNFDQVKDDARITVELTIKETGEARAGEAPGQDQEILVAHNKYRDAVGVPALQWSDGLAGSAQQYANYLASTGQFQHSGTPGVGENLARGTPPSAWTVTQLVDMWGNEKQHFIRGIFPNVSNTGNWEDVGHYTQIVWRNTTHVACGVATGNGYIVMVGRYSPPGNVDGEPVY